MADQIDSENKRRSAGNSVPYVIYPIPDGQIDDFNREQALWLYGGLGTGAAPPPPPPAPEEAAVILGGGLFSKRSKRAPVLAMRDMTEEDEELMVLL